MTHRACSEEPDVLIAATSGRALSASLAAHLASCPSCREQAEAVAFVRGLAETPDAAHPLPDPAVLWWKAQLLRRWESERRAIAPMERMHWIEITAGVVSLGVFLVWQWSGLVNLAARLSPASLAAISSSASTVANPLVVMLILGGTVALGGTIFASLHRMLTHD